MKRVVYLLILGLSVLTCSNDDIPSEQLLKSYTEPSLNFGASSEEIIEEIGPPDKWFGDETDRAFDIAYFEPQDGLESVYY
jgi:hypothetical protein